MKHDTDNLTKTLESTRGFLHCPKISRILVYKRLKSETEFLPTLGILFRPQSIAHALSGTTAAQIRSPKIIVT